MDKIDFEILRRLSVDARTPFKRIAKELGVGTDTIFRRFKKLEQQGIVLGSTVILSSEACGIQGLCGLFIKAKSGSNLSHVADKLKEMPEISETFQVIGEYDFYVDVFYKDFDEVIALINKLRCIEDITVIDPMIYSQKDWSIPFLFNFEAELPIWAYPVKRD